MAEILNPASLPDGKRKGINCWFGLALVVGLALFLGSISLLGYQWLKSQNPNCVIIVKGEESLKDATVTVDPVPMLDKKSRTVARFSDYPDKNIRFHVPVGEYHVKVSDAAKKLEINDRVICEKAGVIILVFPGKSVVVSSQPTAND